MRTTADRGLIYRRCGCRDTHRHQLGAHCPRLLADTHHGTWTFAVDVPAPDRHRATVRRGGFTSHDTGEVALTKFLEGEAGGFNADPNQTVADYLHTWLVAKALKPTTMARYRDYVHNDLVPAFGSLKLDELRHRHISAFVTHELAGGRGRTTLYRCLATLSSALGDAVRQHRLAHNPASPPALRRPPSPERRIWTADEAVRFLPHCHEADPEMADLFEFLIGTGLRKGEALGLHWDDLHLREGVLYVRCTLSAIDNNRLVISPPASPSPWSPRPCATPPCRPLPTSTAISPGRPPAKPSTPSSRGSPGPSRKPAARPGWSGCDHQRPHPTTPRIPQPAPLPHPARLPNLREPARHPVCDHSATTSSPGTRKAALP
ncbi:tyrosine-type recombinase/integrase [Streptomyces sp. NBC_00038]|uniref:tyrosine-type recombinase/integrase n=1 Tax=Streptomyces sp. NBC_00038 TaxID=2903615 RepID=UPI00225766FB|nr:tyrosine-type recombinase/integrase [Streptomyces sp. NBC_00038]MCX5562350.1 tyrosine-type recombinase/integrase [Streptomyces sp. NBC_00038]